MATPHVAWLEPVIPAHSTLAELGLPGVRHVLDRKAPIWSRASWAAVIVVCMALVAWQVNERVVFLRDSSVSVDVKVVPNAALNFPYLTVCPRNRENDPHLQYIFGRMPKIRRDDSSLRKQMDVCDIVGFENTTAEEAWLKGYDVGSVFFKRSTADVPSPQINFTKHLTNTYFGNCTTFYPEQFPIRTLTAELRFIFWRTYTIPRAQIVLYSVLLHREPNVTDIELAMADDLPFYSNVVHTLEVNQFTYLNTTQRPCTDVHEHFLCRQRCFTDAVVRAAKCRLPYMILDKPGQLPLCLNPEECRQAAESTRVVYASHNWNACNCPRQCSKTVYGGSRTIEPTDSPWVYLRIGVQSTRVTLAEEYYSYTIVSFLCDVGGTLGLFLGLCLLTVIEILEGFFWSLMQVLKKKEKVANKAKMDGRNLIRHHYRHSYGLNSDVF